MVGEGSTVKLELRAGGGLIEHHEDGSSLLWATVHMHLPAQFTLYLFGHTVKDWGGPVTSNMKISVEADGEERSIFRFSDARHGHIDDANIKSLEEGWTQLFTDGLKKYLDHAPDK